MVAQAPTESLPEATSLSPQLHAAALRLNATDLMEAATFRLLLERQAHEQELRAKMAQLRSELGNLQAEREDLLRTAESRGQTDLAQLTGSVDGEIGKRVERIQRIEDELNNPPPLEVKLPGQDDPLLLEYAPSSDLSRMADNPLIARELKLVARRSNAQGTNAAEWRGRIADWLRTQPVISVAYANPLLAMAAGIILLFGTLIFWPSGDSGHQPAAVISPAVVVATPPPPTATPYQPPASPTPPHAGWAAPSRLVISLGTVELDLPIIPADWQTAQDGVRAIYPAATPALGASGTPLLHYGSYPGEAGNLVLMGPWDGFGAAATRLQINDPIIVTNRKGEKYGYQVTSCDGTGVRFCTTAKDDLWPLGRTPRPTLTLIASQTGEENIVIRARFVGLIADKQ